MDSSRSLDNCAECALLLSKYEDATFELARIENTLDIAQHNFDIPSIRRFTGEAQDVAARHRAARAAFLQHRDTTHPPSRMLTMKSSCAGPGNSA